MRSFGAWGAPSRTPAEFVRFVSRDLPFHCCRFTVAVSLLPAVFSDAGQDLSPTYSHEPRSSTTAARRLPRQSCRWKPDPIRDDARREGR